MVSFQDTEWKVFPRFVLPIRHTLFVWRFWRHMVAYGTFSRAYVRTIRQC